MHRHPRIHLDLCKSVCQTLFKALDFGSKNPMIKFEKFGYFKPFQEIRVGKASWKEREVGKFEIGKFSRNCFRLTWRPEMRGQ